MAESNKRFGRLESEFGHDFETLANRLRSVYQKLDELAHADSSPHYEHEELYMSVQINGEVREVFCEVNGHDWMKVRTQDSQGDQAHEYRCSLKTERKHSGGKHRAGGRPAYEAAPHRSSTPQIDMMIVMAGLLEASHQDLLTHDDSVILAYEI